MRGLGLLPLQLGCVVAERWSGAAIDQNRRSVGVDLMSVLPNRLPWFVVLACVVSALVMHGRAESGLPFVAGLPAWVLIFIGLQGALTFTAAWIARP